MILFFLFCSIVDPHETTEKSRVLRKQFSPFHMQNTKGGIDFEQLESERFEKTGKFLTAYITVIINCGV